MRHPVRACPSSLGSLGSLGLCLVVLAGCASPPRSTLRDADPVLPRSAPDRDAGGMQSLPPPSPAPAAKPAPVAAAGLGQEVVRVARGFLGAPYRFAGRGPESFDCSGLVQRSFEAVGVRVPRTSRELAKTGQPVSPAALQPGDLVLFADSRGAVNHVGIFSGRGRFVHASSSRGVVEDALGSEWFRARFVGARRLMER